MKVDYRNIVTLCIFIDRTLKLNKNCVKKQTGVEGSLKREAFRLITVFRDYLILFVLTCNRKLVVCICNSMFATV